LRARRRAVQRAQRGRDARLAYETAADPLSLHRLYLRIYRERTGGLLPDCNEWP
jgi:hypothetical protein